VEKIPEVERAKALMNEAMTWSVMKWLREKKRVRKTADQANAALDQLRRTVGDSWTDSIRAAYKKLDAQTKDRHGDRDIEKEKDSGANRHEQEAKSASGDFEASLIAKSIKEADDAAYCSRMDAEKSFDDAEKLLSTSLAREGCRKAIHSWELYEIAIRRAESALRAK
jgi:hypothetical protein